MVISFVRRFISSLKTGQLFTTRDCLSFGSRAAIDKALSRLVKSGQLIRLARGVFCKDGYALKFPSPLELARVKAQAFGKSLARHGANVASELIYDSKRNEETIFAVDGRSSAFRYGNLLIQLRGTCKRKTHLGDEMVFSIIRALWNIGVKTVNKELIGQATRKCGRIERQALRQAARWMPGWMSAHFLKRSM